MEFLTYVLNSLLKNIIMNKETAQRQNIIKEDSTND